jgi:thiol-disulfide isomerase/thioredoxin
MPSNLIRALPNTAVPASPSARRRRRFGVLALLVAGALCTSFGTAMAVAERSGSEAPLDAAPLDAAPLDAAPLNAALERLEGGKLHLSELRGGPALLELWATWCLPCKQQAKILDQLAPEIEARGVEVLAVDVGEARKVVKAYLEESPKEFPVLLDRGQVLAGLLDIGELPVLVLLDASGRVAGLHLGLAQPQEVLDLLERARPAALGD